MKYISGFDNMVHLYSAVLLEITKMPILGVLKFVKDRVKGFGNRMLGNTFRAQHDQLRISDPQLSFARIFEKKFSFKRCTRLISKSAFPTTSSMSGVITADCESIVTSAC